jgi:hypothetical protein
MPVDLRQTDYLEGSLCRHAIVGIIPNVGRASATALQKLPNVLCKRRSQKECVCCQRQRRVTPGDGYRGVNQSRPPFECAVEYFYLLVVGQISGHPNSKYR